MPSRRSPWIATVVGMCALLAGSAASVWAQTSRDYRSGAADARRAAEEQTQRRSLEQMRQSLDADARARAAEQRMRDMKRQTDQISKEAR